MINRDDMLELTRRMTPARASIDRIAGAYFDEERLNAYIRQVYSTCKIIEYIIHVYRAIL